jgi:hypothetical protein
MCVYIIYVCLVEFTANKFGVLILDSYPDVSLVWFNSVLMGMILEIFIISAFESFVCVTRDLMS